ncbi:MAG: transposase, partial [Pseudomonadota bacterium]
MPTVAEALRQHGDDYLKQFGNTMPREHKRVLALINRCRTGELGHLRYQCDACSREHWVGRSCGNRHCPNCQQDKSQLWLAKRMRQLLPVQYYLVTFTVPGTLRMVVRSNQRACYNALFDCGARTLVELASGKRFIGTDRMGFFGALHTWGRDFTAYNPHVHFVVAGGGVSQDGSQWMSAPENFLLPQRAAAKVYAGKFRHAMREAGLEQAFQQADAKAWFAPWVVDVQSVGNGEAALKYLAPYINRVAISNNRIESVDEPSVT